MLVLSRKEGESIFIGEDVIVTVLDIFRDKVRIGITAPGRIKISRTPPPKQPIGSQSTEGMTGAKTGVSTKKEES